MDNKSIIKSIQRGIIAEIEYGGSYIDIKINPVNINKSILLFNSSGQSLGIDANDIVHSPLVYLKDEETIRIIGYVRNDSYQLPSSVIPRCSWQVIEFN